MNYCIAIISANKNIDNEVIRRNLFINKLPMLREDVFDEIILVKWNRDYPFDKKMSFSLKWYKLRKLIEFEGDSHDKISLEFYEKRGDI